MGTHALASASDSGPAPVALHRPVTPGTASRPSYALELHSCLQAGKENIVRKRLEGVEETRGC